MCPAQQFLPGRAFPGAGFANSCPEEKLAEERGGEMDAAHLLGRVQAAACASPAQSPAQGHLECSHFPFPTSCSAALALVPAAFTSPVRNGGAGHGGLIGSSALPTGTERAFGNRNRKAALVFLQRLEELCLVSFRAEAAGSLQGLGDGWGKGQGADKMRGCQSNPAFIST